MSHLEMGQSRQYNIEQLAEAQNNILAKLSGPHTKCTTEKPAEYPERRIPDQCSGFEDPRYQPEIYLDSETYGSLYSPIPRSSRKSWASELPESRAEIILYLDSLEKNPGGPTGIRGPGKLGKPKNWAADPVVMSVNPETGEIFQVQIQRKDGQWAIPGGMVDDDETPLSAAVRELLEETGIQFTDISPVQLYKGYCDDHRNTDTHYMMTSVYLYFIPWADFNKFEFKTIDQAEGILSRKEVKLDRENVNSLFASHPDFVKLALIEIASKVGDLNLDRLAEQNLLRTCAQIVGVA